MHKKSVGLINVYYPESGYGDKLEYPPLGLAHISEYLSSKGIDHDVIDMGLGYSIYQVFFRIEKMNPEWIGISINSLMIDKTNDLVELIKKFLPDTKIVVGGSHVTTRGSRIFEDLPHIDYGIAGEGEIALYALVSNQMKGKISGLIYKEHNRIIENIRSVSKDIDIFPTPSFSKFEMNKYKKIIPVCTSRGCPYQCAFCQQSSLLSKHWRGTTADYFINTIKKWKKKGYNIFHIVDDNFAFSKKRLIEIANKIKDRVDISLIGGIRVHTATTEVLKLLKKIGIDYISFGIESYSDRVLKFIKKGTTKEEIDKVVKNAIDLGFKVRLFFIIGFPYQTVESLNNTYKFILENNVYQIRFFNLIPYEHTMIMEWIKKNGKLLYKPSVYMNEFKKYQDIPLFIGNDMMSIEDRKEHLYISRQLEKVVEERRKDIW